MAFTLEFEKPIVELEMKIKELRDFSAIEKLDFSDEIRKLEKKLHKLQLEVFSNLSPWQRCQIARHPNRPYTMDYIRALMTDFVELHGDRYFAEDRAIVAGLARFEGMAIVVIGHQKGRDTKEKLARNFAMAHPEGYRKALRMMKLAEKFGKPFLSIIDTPGAYPGIGAEERGQAEAIAKNLREMAELRTPILVVVTGEGGSGGALGVGVGDIILMLEYAFYSVISPEGCASILWKEKGTTIEAISAAANNLGLTPQVLKRLGLIDEIVPEPLGGAHRNPQQMMQILKGYLLKHLQHLRKIPIEELLELRYQKYRRMGVYEEG